MKQIRNIFLIAISIFVSQATWADGPFAEKSDGRYAIQFLEHLRKNKPDLFREGEPVSIKMVRGTQPWGTTNFEIYIEYQFKTGWLIAQVTIPVKHSSQYDNSSRLKYVIYKTTKSVNYYQFSLTGNEQIVEEGGNKYLIKEFEDGTKLRANIWSEVKTTIGIFRVVAKEYPDEAGYGMSDTLLLNNREVYRGNGYLRVYGVYHIGQQPWVIVGSNQGGSRTPSDYLSCLRINKDGSVTEVQYDPPWKFFSERNKVKVTEEENSLIMDLGLSNQKQKIAILKNNKISIEYRPVKHTPLTEELCRKLYEITERDCADEHFKNECDRYAVNLVPVSNISSSWLRHIKNQPGFNQEGFNQKCLSACKSGKAPEYDKFSNAACGFDKK